MQLIRLLGLLVRGLRVERRAALVAPANRGVSECAGEILSCAEVELAVSAREVAFDGAEGNEERLGDLAITEAVRGELCDSPLARG